MFLEEWPRDYLNQNPLCISLTFRFLGSNSDRSFCFGLGPSFFWFLFLWTGKPCPKQSPGQQWESGSELCLSKTPHCHSHQWLFLLCCPLPTLPPPNTHTHWTVCVCDHVMLSYLSPPFLLISLLFFHLNPTFLYLSSWTACLNYFGVSYNSSI